MTKVKEMDPNPLLCSENALLAERSFMNEHDKTSVDNGHNVEWTEKMATNMLPSQGVYSQVVIFRL